MGISICMSTSGEHLAQWREDLKTVPRRLLAPVQQRADTSDLAQDALLQLWLQQATTDKTNRAYLAKVARGHAWKLCRYHNQDCRSVQKESALQDEPGTTITPEAIIEKREQLAWLARQLQLCLLYTSPSPRDATLSRMPSSA